MNFLRKLFNLPIKERPSGICRYCGQQAFTENCFMPGLFYHYDCVEAEAERLRKQKAEREQIDLYKKAIREVEAENKACTEAGG